MNIILALFFYLFCVTTTQCADTELPIKITRNETTEENIQSEPVSLLIAIHGTSSQGMAIAECIRHDLERAKTIRVTIQSIEQPTYTNDIAHYFNEGYPFVLYISMQEGDTAVRARLYNTLDVTMLQGKKWYNYTTDATCAHHIADSVWKEVIGTESCFLSSLVYVTKEYKRSGKVRCNLVVTDWDGSRSRIILSKNSHILAPAWLIDDTGHDQAILFSEFTLTNVRLMKAFATTSASPEIVLNRNGTTVGVSPLSLHNIVYCHSGALWRYTYDPTTHGGKHTCIIRETEPCACPIALRNGDVMYCCKGAIKRWDVVNNTQKNITKKGFCTSPAVHEGRNILLFSRRIKGNFQLIKKDLDSDEEHQITHGPGNKIDASIAPCGWWAVYTVEHNKKSSIYLINLLNNETCEISDPSQHCMCPAWSPQ